MSKPGEFDLIAKYFAPLAGENSFSLKDDAAQLNTSDGCSMVVTQDAIAESVHFFHKDPPRLIAQKALRVNLSDLAAKGAMPIGFSLALGLGKDWSEEWVKEFSEGLRADCETYGIPLTGGDTFMTGGGFVISITAFGEVPEGQYKSRLTAKAGDILYVSGSIGDGALGLLARQNKLAGRIDQEHVQYLVDRYLKPQPRVEAIELVRKFASASMDISDGLMGDAEKLAKASGVSLTIECPKVPISDAANALIEAESEYLETALTGGDDYEILLAVPNEHQEAFKLAAMELPIPFTEIGKVCSGQGVKAFDMHGEVMKVQRSSFDHLGE